jgi:tetratricopeptide (TPR) repeat protein
MFVGWEATGYRAVSHAETVGMGGLFLHTPSPLAEGSFIRLVFDLKTGEVRARAIVRYSSPGKGMGVQFVQMETTDRQRLNQFLSHYAEVKAAAIPKPAGRTSPAAEASTTAIVRYSSPGKWMEVQFLHIETTDPAAEPSATMSERALRETSEALRWGRELGEALELARAGTYYQLLGVASESPSKQIKRSFYALVRKFHPDYHMAKSESMEPLKELMEAVTVAYKTLSDQEKRATYDAQLTNSGVYNLRRIKTVSQKNIEDCFSHATECLHAENFVGSVTWLRRCVEMAPEEAKYRALLARSLWTIPQYRNEAIEQYKRAIKLDSWNVRVLLQFAELYEELQLPLKARPLYSKILEIDPLNAKARERTNPNAEK